MTTAAKLQAVIEAQTKHFDKRMDEVDARLDVLAVEGSKKVETFEKRTKASFDRTGKALKSFAANMTIGLSLPLTALGKTTFDAAIQMDGLKRTLQTIMGDSRAAAIEFDKLSRAAKLPGLDLRQAIQGSANLQSIGFSADDARRSLVQVANELAKFGGGKEEFSRMVVNLTQVSGAAMLAGDELREMSAIVPTLRKALVEMYGTADTKKIKELGISGKQFIQDWTNWLAKQTRASADSMKNMVDNFEQELFEMKAQLGEALIPVAREILPQIIKGVKDLVTWFKNLAPETQTLVVKMGLLAVALGPVSGVLSGLVGILRVGGSVITWYRSLSVATDSATAAQLRLNAAMLKGIGFAGKAAGLAGVALSLGGTDDYQAANSRRFQSWLKDTTEGKELADLVRKGGPSALMEKYLKEYAQYGSKAKMAAADSVKKVLPDIYSAFPDIKKKWTKTVSGKPLELQLLDTVDWMRGMITSQGVVNGSSKLNGGNVPFKVDPSAISSPGVAFGENIGGNISKLVDWEGLAAFVEPATAALNKFKEGLKQVAVERAKLLDPRTEVADFFQMDLGEFKLLDEETQKLARGRFEVERWAKAIPDLFNYLNGLGDTAQSAFDQAADAQKRWAENGIAAFKAWFQSLQDIKSAGLAKELQHAVDAASEQIDKFGSDEIVTKAQRMKDLWLDVADGIGGAFANAFRDLDQGFDNFFSNVVEGVNDMILDISAQIIKAQLTKLIVGAFGLGSIAGKASGGPVSGGTPYVVGEKGPELFIPKSSGHIVPNHKMGGGTTIVMNITTPDAGSFRRSQNQIMQDAYRRAALLDQQG
jgi:tape measure domain-containing protein